ncbi:putative transmembrane protein, partial [Apostichopus japonicus]
PICLFRYRNGNLRREDKVTMEQGRLEQQQLKMGAFDNSSIFSHIIIGVTISLCFWSIFYKLINSINPSKRCEWNFNIVAMCFSVLIVIMSFICIVCFNPPLLTNLGQPSNPAAFRTLCFSLGYFCYDTLWCVIHWAEKKDVPNIIHHIITILIHCLALFSGVCAEIGTNVLFGTEISTPLLLARWFMREKEMKNHILYHINDFVFVVLFLTFRLGIGTWYIWTLLTDPKCPPMTVTKLFLLSIYLISLGFAVSLCRMVYFKIKKLSRPTVEYIHHGDEKVSTAVDINFNEPQT